MAIRVNCAAISAVLRFSTLVKSYNSSEERIMISFERTKTNHDIDKLRHKNNSQNYIAVKVKPGKYMYI